VPAPVELPDSARHKLCRRCGRWYEPADGVMRPRSDLRLVGWIEREGRAFAGLEPQLYFVCNGCLRRRRIVVAIIGLIFLAVVAFALIHGYPTDGGL